MPAEPIHDSERFRSPADFLRLIVAAVALVVLLVVAWLFGDTLVLFASDLFSGLSAIPDWLLTAVIAGTRVLTFAVLVGGLLWTAVHDRWSAPAAMALGTVIAVALVALFEKVVDLDEGAVVAASDADLGALTSGSFPTAFGIAVLSAALTAGAPWLSRRWRDVGWVAVIALVVVRTLTWAMSFGSVGAVLIGWFAGAVAVVIVGAPPRRANAASIAAGLATVGLAIDEITPAKVDARGSTPYFAVLSDGGRLFVKVLGRDERSADLMFRVYRKLQRRELGDERPFSSLRRAVEHEALLALAASDLGIRTPRFRALAVAEPSSLVLAYDAVAGKSLDQLDPSDVTDEVLDAIWAAIADLRRHGIAHRDLRLANVFLGSDGEVWIIDFGFSEMAASELLLANDVAELVCSSSLYVGAERAVAPALATVDRRTLDRAVERLRPWALSGATRTALKQHPALLADLRRRLAP